MIPKKVILENFLSFGPRTVIEFTDDEPIWVLGGANGTGKSAVFDAMTFALFGVHRGGVSGQDLLVRHGENGFSIAFEFEFNGMDYRISRNRMGQRSTASVEEKLPVQGPEAWKRVANVNAVTDVKPWTERTLGMGFEAFRASVLLRQGEADKIVNAKGTERLNILKRIIGADRYEAFSDRVRKATKTIKDRYDSLKTELDQRAEAGRGKISDEQLAEAAEVVREAADERKRAQNQLLRAKEHVGLAKRWVELECKLKEMTDQVRAAKARAASAQLIRDNKAELDALSAVVPVLRNMVAVRTRIERAGAAQEEMASRLYALKAEVLRLAALLADSNSKADEFQREAEHEIREGKQLRIDAEREQKFMAAAETIAKLQKDLDEFLPNLDILVQDARSRTKTAGDEVTRAAKTRIEADTLLKPAKSLLKEFEKVGAGVKCTRCRQVVTVEHAAREREEIAKEIAALESRLQDAKTAEKRAMDEAETARNEFESLEKQVKLRDRTAHDLETQKKTLAGLGVQNDAAELKLEVERKTALAVEHERRGAEAKKKEESARSVAARAEGDHKVAARDLATLEAQLHAGEQKLNEDRGQIHVLRDQLPPLWQSRADAIDSVEIEKLAARRQHLAASNVEEEFKQLQTDDALRKEWDRQIDSIQQEIEAIPAEARVTVLQAEEHVREATSKETEADKALTTARDAEITLKQQKEEHEQKIEDLRTTERDLDLHTKLDELLGKKGIQRELVRDAEEEIVRLANDTVQKLSNGDLSLELDRSADSDDEAFELRVQQSERPAPTAVEYLSGSEKFRVSVAVALAIGRYATGKTRPLESVIIDEGFGSLDRDGLEATRLELNRLSQYLKKIILVSHQEEFANEFPVVIQLTRGPDGTTATTVRR